MMKSKWLIGRQHSVGTPYYKFPLLVSKRLKFDSYILKYPTGSSINWHTDPAEPGFEHHRLNIVLKKAVGGIFMTKTKYQYVECAHNDRVILFRPDMTTHCVTKVQQGTRYVLSIGWLRKSK